MTLAELRSVLDNVAFEQADKGVTAEDIEVVLRDTDHYSHVYALTAENISFNPLTQEVVLG